MESEWVDGGSEAARSVWRSERPHGGMAGMAMFFVCLLAVAFIPGSGVGIWVARIGIVIIVPALVAVVWNRIEQPETRTPDILVGVDASTLRITLFATAKNPNDEYSQDTHALTKPSTILWTRGTHGSFDWPLLDGNSPAIGRFEVDDTRIRLTGTRPVADDITTRLARHADMFGQLFPHPAVAMDPDGQWIAFDPNGRLLRG